MRVARFASLATLAWLVALGFSVVPSAQAPMTEDDYDKAMKSVGATVGSMRKNAEAQNAEGLAADAKKMAELQKANVAFWTARKAQDAVEWATAAVTHATAVDKAAAAKDMAAAGEAMKMLMGTCAQCHGKYRDKGADGGYIIKKP